MKFTLLLGSLFALYVLTMVCIFTCYAQTAEDTGGRVAISITRKASQASSQGGADYFSGTVRIDTLFKTTVPARTSGGRVTFDPGARTAWHSHPLGQTLIVTAGTGRVQRWGDPVEEIWQGDVVWIPPGQKHWHGASPNSAMTHIAIAEQLDGTAAQWLEKVSDEQYHGKPGGRHE